MRLCLAAALSALSLVLPFATASAQTYPDKPIRIIVPYGPGGVDGQMRLAQPFMDFRQLMANPMPRFVMSSEGQR